VETASLRTLYVLFFIELSTRRSRPDWAWVTQQARILAIAGSLEDLELLIRDRDAKFAGPFDEVFRSEGLTVIKTPVRAPRANAVAEWWVGTVRGECLDHVLVFGWRHLQHVLAAYAEHYNRARPRRGLDLRRRIPESVGRRSPRRGSSVVRASGLIHQYCEAAA